MSDYRWAGRRNPAGRLLAFAALLVIGGATLVPLPQKAAAARMTPLWCLVCGDYGGVDVFNNVLLFIPLGLGLSLAGFPTRAVVATGAVLSLSIELLQRGVIVGRDASLSDLLTNTLGTWLGALLAINASGLLNPTRTQSLRLAGWGTIFWLGVQTVTAVLLRPWVPGGELRGVWARLIPGRQPFDGQVISASLSGWPLPGDSMPIGSDLKAMIQEGRIRLELQLLSGCHTGLGSPVIELLGSRGAVLAVEALGQHLAFRPPMGSSRLRLARPALRLPQALPQSPGSRVHLAAGERRSTLWAEWTVAGSSHGAVQVLSPSLGWSLLMPSRYAFGPETRLVTMIWLVGWLTPLGYWAAGARLPPVIRVGALLALVSVGLGLIPLLGGYPGVHWSEWLAALVGLTAGGAGHRFAPYFEERCDSPSINESC